MTGSGMGLAWQKIFRRKRRMSWGKNCSAKIVKAA
jgi:hypothetical protein